MARVEQKVRSDLTKFPSEIEYRIGKSYPFRGILQSQKRKNQQIRNSMANKNFVQKTSAGEPVEANDLTHLSGCPFVPG